MGANPHPVGDGHGYRQFDKDDARSITRTPKPRLPTRTDRPGSLSMGAPRIERPPAGAGRSATGLLRRPRPEVCKRWNRGRRRPNVPQRLIQRVRKASAALFPSGPLIDHRSSHLSFPEEGNSRKRNRAQDRVTERSGGLDPKDGDSSVSAKSESLSGLGSKGGCLTVAWRSGDDRDRGRHGQGRLRSDKRGVDEAPGVLSRCQAPKARSRSSPGRRPGLWRQPRHGRSARFSRLRARTVTTGAQGERV